MTTFTRYYKIIPTFKPAQTTVDMAGRFVDTADVVYGSDGQMWRTAWDQGVACQDCGLTNKWGYGLCDARMSKAGRYARKLVVKQYVCHKCAVIVEIELPKAA